MFDEKAIFIGGMFKSGTTLLRNMLGQHPNLFSGFETKWFLLDNPEKRADRLDMLSKLYEQDPEHLQKLWEEAGSGAAFLSVFMNGNLKESDKARWIDKTPENIMHADEIFKSWSNGKLIHIVRDPRDVFVGRREAKGLDVEAFVDVYEKMFMPCLDLFGKKTNQYMDIRYEDLINNPKGTMKKVLAFIGEPWNEAVSVYEGSDKDYKAVKEITGRDQTTLKKLTGPMTKSYIGRWVDQISAEEEHYIRTKLQKFMKPYEYFERKAA